MEKISERGKSVARSPLYLPGIYPDIAGIFRQQNAERAMSPPRTWRILPESHRIARERIEAISRLRQAPSLSVERSESVELVLIPMGRE
jgi:hypothetical protein